MRGKNWVLLVGVLIAANLCAVLLFRHEGRVLKAVRIYEADVRAEEYAGVLEDLKERQQWIAMDAFADLHEIRQSRSALYDPYRRLLKASSEYEEAVEMCLRETGGFDEDGTVLFESYKDEKGDYLADLRKEEILALQNMEERVKKLEKN